MPSALLVLGFTSVLAAGLLLTSSLRNRSLSEVLKGITSPSKGSAQAVANIEGGSGESGESGSANASFGPAPAPSSTHIGATYGTPSSNQVGKEAYDYFTGQGLSGDQAAGIIGNLQQESSLNPNEAGGGLAQFIGARGAKLQAFAASKREPASSVRAQLEYIWHELSTDEIGTLDELKKATSPGQAAQIFSERFERPGVPELSNREVYAMQAANEYR